jgi:translation initiation factor IF-1
MSKDDLIDMQGTVVAVHSGGLYRVQVDAGHEVLAQLSGRMRRFRIKVVPGDRVTVGISPYDPQRGIITFRATSYRLRPVFTAARLTVPPPTPRPCPSARGG